MRVGDRGSIVVGWLTKLVVLFAVLGLLGHDAVKIVVANFAAADDAGVAASAAADTYAAKKDIRAAYAAAVDAVAGKGDTVATEGFTVAADGRVTLTVERTPTTLWMKHVGPLKKYTIVRQSGSGALPE